MRVGIGQKFVTGLVLVVFSIVLIDLGVPLLGIPAQWTQGVSIVCALGIGLLLGWLFSRSFSARIRLLGASAENLRKGDLSRDIVLPKGAFPDETHDLATSLNEVTTALRELVGYIRASSFKVAEAAQSLSATSQEMTASAHEVTNTIEQVSRGAETQAEMVERSSKTVKDLAFSIERIADSAKKVAASANDTVLTAQKGGETARTSLKMMKQVLDEVDRIGGQMFSFGEQLHKVGKIVEVITGIAQKTNLLALNATIEAARAGEYGRGFAVVAEEISKLADSTGHSAGEITELVEQIREESRRMQGAMKETIGHMDAGRIAMDSTGSAFGEIIRTSLDTQSKAIGIAELSQSQTRGASGMVAVIDEISRVVTENAAATEQVSAATEEQSASMEEMAHAAQDLAALSEELLDRVRRFRLERDTAQTQ